MPKAKAGGLQVQGHPGLKEKKNPHEVIVESLICAKLTAHLEVQDYFQTPSKIKEVLFSFNILLGLGI
jgi:hypothetical protein